jgi:hypothetical protein
LRLRAEVLRAAMSSRKSFFFFLFLKQRPRDGANLLAGNLKIAMLYIHKKSDCAMPSYVTYLSELFQDNPLELQESG